MTKEELENIVKKSTSYSQVLIHLSRAPVGNNITSIRNKIKQLGIDISHFTGQGHNKGKVSNKKTPPDELLVKRIGAKVAPYRLREALQAKGIEERCALCPTGTEWNGKFLRLHVDHINGDPTDNAAGNLRFLCPNCHSQTETFGSRNKK